jgi:hypothetical protein
MSGESWLLDFVQFSEIRVDSVLGWFWMRTSLERVQICGLWFQGLIFLFPLWWGSMWNLPHMSNVKSDPSNVYLQMIISFQWPGDSGWIKLGRGTLKLVGILGLWDYARLWDYAHPSNIKHPHCLVPNINVVSSCFIPYFRGVLGCLLWKREGIVPLNYICKRSQTE